MDTILTITDASGKFIREQVCFAYVELTPNYLERYVLAANPQDTLPNNFKVTARKVPSARQEPLKPFDCRMPVGATTVPYKACPSCQTNLLRVHHTKQCPNCGQALK